MARLYLIFLDFQYYQISKYLTLFEFYADSMEANLNAFYFYEGNRRPPEYQILKSAHQCLNVYSLAKELYQCRPYIAAKMPLEVRLKTNCLVELISKF